MTEKKNREGREREKNQQLKSKNQGEVREKICNDCFPVSPTFAEQRKVNISKKEIPEKMCNDGFLVN